MAFALVVAACGVAPDSAGDLRVEDPASERMCQAFIDETEQLREQDDYYGYVEVLRAASLPLVEYVWGLEIELSQETMMSLEDVGYGEPDIDDLDAFDEVGALFASDEGTICEELSRNLGFMPAPPGPGWDTPPALNIVSVYEDGSIDKACDVFVQTMHGWLDIRTSGAEIGVAIADLTDELIATLEASGVAEGTDDLRVYSDKYRSLQIVQAAEEAEQHLVAASRKLAAHSEVCGHLSTWGSSPGSPNDISYHEGRWSNYGYETYHYQLAVSDTSQVRSHESYIVVVTESSTTDVYAIRTAEQTEDLDTDPLTMFDMFQFIEESGLVTDVSFHPVLGHPRHVRTQSRSFFISDLEEGSEFDRSILGSTAELRIAVRAIDEFEPGKACGHARIDAGVPIPTSGPLDDDARQAIDALRDNPEGSNFVENYEYWVFEKTSDYLVLLGISDSGEYSDAAFERKDGKWSPTGWGGCHWSDDGYEKTDWALNPDSEVDPEGDTLELVVNDRCGSTTEYGHEMLAVAEFATDEVEITVWQARNPPPPPPGSPEVFRELSCSLGTIVQLTVLLSEPIGDRALIGASEPIDWSGP